MILKEQNEKVVYSDGEITEKRMLDIAQKYPEDASEDYIGDCSEYTVNNTFSSVRRNILNWYPFKKDADILEIGAGMGALTGLLCDKARSVTSIEMSEDRAKVIQARYADRKNLKVIREDITTWESTQKFDYVVFIGVLEYAGVFSEQTDAYENFLKSAKKFLKSDGALLFAIENKLGLKYWLGGSEDHLQEPFAGLEGYVTPHTPQTFSKKELENMLVKVGLKNNRFYYVLPDYKFPEIIATDERYPDYVNLQKVSFTYSKNSILTVDEKKLYKDVLENKTLSFFANSFLVEAQINEFAGKKVVYVSSKGEVRKEYRVSTVLYDDGSICKIPMHQKALKHLDNIYKNTEYLKNRGIHILGYTQEGDTLKCETYEGVSAQDYFGSLLENNDRKNLFPFLEEFRKELIKSSELVFDENILNEMEINTTEYQIGPVLKKGFVDMTFYNSFYENGQFIFYDQEWCFDNVPLNFIIYYAVNSAYSRLQIKTEITLQEIWNYLKIGNETTIFARLESYVWSNVLYRQTDFYGDGGYCNRFNKEMTVNAKLGKLNAHIQEMENAQQSLDKELLSEKEKTEELSNDLKKKEEEAEKLKKELDLKKEETEKLERKLDFEREEGRKKEQRFQEKEAAWNKKEKEFFEEQIKLKQEVLNKEGHVQLLLPAERERDAIVQSKMFKTMRFVCRSYDIVMIGPRFIGRNIAAFCRMMTHVNWQEIKIAAGYVKREGFLGAYHHLMRDYHQGEIKQIQVEVEDKIFDEITDIDACEKIEFPLVENPTVSIVIPAYNQFTYTYYCLKSILENSGDVSYEVILADDCSTDITREIHKAVKNLIVARTEKNMLFLRNCNQAAKKAKGKYILFLNNDTQVQKDWLKPLVDLCERDATVGMTGSKLVYADGTLQEAGGIIWKDASGWNYGRNTDAMLPEYNYVRDVDYISGASIMIRRSLWEELGGFDEYFAPAYYEDSDLAFQVRKAGYRVVYQPLSVVVHFEGKSNGTDLNSGVKKNQVENQLKFRDKWKDVLNKENLPNGQEVYLAKDRSQLKKRILVVDHYVPHYDNDAGGRCTYMYLKLFLKLGMKVTFIGDNFYPHEPYTTELTQMGIEILYGNYYCTHWQEWLKENLHYFDYVYLQRPHIAIKYIDIVKQYGKGKIFYFAHDLHFLRLTREYELTKDEKYLEEAEHFRKDEFYLFDKADVVHVVGSYEQAVLQKELPDKAIRNIPLYIYEELLSDINKDFTTRNDIIFVGGFGHPPNVDAVLWFAKEVFPGIVEKYPDIVWHIVGSKAPKEVQELAGKNIVLEGFVSDEDLDKMYRRCRLAVVPLRVGAGVKGKVVEAAYYQIPLVTTSIGEEGISDKEGAFIAEDDAKKMTELISSLYTDYKKLREMSDGGIELIRNHYMLSEAERVLTQDL